MHGIINVKDFPKKASDYDKKNIEKKDYAFILLNLYDKVFKEVSKENIFENVFSKLYSIYLQKSLFGKVHLKHYFYSFKIDLSKDLEQNHDDSKRLIT